LIHQGAPSDNTLGSRSHSKVRWRDGKVGFDLVYPQNKTTTNSSALFAEWWIHK
jgi:hypothetical protein